MGERQKFRVLLVADSLAGAKSAGELFGEADYEVTLVHELHAAIAAFRSRPFDAILLNLNLAEPSAMETLRQMRAANPDAPIVVFAENADEHMTAAARNDGARAVFGKFNTPTRRLAQAIENAVDRWRADRQREQLLNIVSSTPDAVIVSDEAGVVLFVNQAAITLFGKEKDALLCERLPFSAAQDGVSVIEIVRTDGVRNAEVRVARFDWLGKPAFLASIRDISEKFHMEAEIRRTNQYLQQANGRLSEFSSLISHDLKSPLMTMLGYARLTLSELPPDALPGVRSNLERIIRAAERMERVITEIRRFSDYGNDEHTLAEVPTHEVVDEMLADLRFSVEKAQATVRVGPLPAVFGNATLIRQVFQNLIENAIKFRREGIAPDLRISSASDGRWVRFCVQDNGIGIRKDIQKQVFQIFKRGNPSAAYDGSGVGLAICERIVHRMGGEISVESEVGKGSIFSFTLPLPETKTQAASSRLR